MLKQSNNPIYLRQAFTAFILKLLYQVKEKRLNYINKSLYLPKMALLKWGCRVVWAVLGIRGMQGYYGTIGLKRKAPPDGTILTKWSCTCPHIIVRGWFGPCGVGFGKAELFELECRCVLQNLVPYVWEMVLSHVHVKCRVIYMNIHNLLYVPGDSLQQWWNIQGLLGIL